MIFAAAVLAVAQLAAAPPAAATKPLTLEKISEPGTGPGGWAWRDATRVTWIVPQGVGPEAPATLPSDPTLVEGAAPVTV